ncbi:MAG: hypothetical protein IPL11_19555 [Candidatus Accumulibacter sp.]|nr:hypothetical protein [Accumulibacter sp.]
MLPPDAHDFFLHFLATAEQVEAGPGQQAGNGVEVGPESVASDACRLEGDRTTAAEAIPDARRVAEAALTGCSTSSASFVAVVPR